MTMFKRFMFLNKILESSSSDDEEEINFIINYMNKKRPKIQNFIDIINEYSDEEVNIYILYRLFYTLL